MSKFTTDLLKAVAIAAVVAVTTEIVKREMKKRNVGWDTIAGLLGRMKWHRANGGQAA